MDSALGIKAPLHGVGERAEKAERHIVSIVHFE